MFLDNIYFHNRTGKFQKAKQKDPAGNPTTTCEAGGMSLSATVQRHRSGFKISYHACPAKRAIFFSRGDEGKPAKGRVKRGAAKKRRIHDGRM